MIWWPLIIVTCPELVALDGFFYLWLEILKRGFQEFNKTCIVCFWHLSVFIWVPLIMFTSLFVIGILPGCTLLWYDNWVNARFQDKIENEMFDVVDLAMQEGSTDSNQQFSLWLTILFYINQFSMLYFV